MARRQSEIEALRKRIEALSPKARVRLLRKVLTPEMELWLIMEDMRRKTRGQDPRAIDRDIREAVREVRLARSASSTS
jgi:hypothetical protein